MKNPIFIFIGLAFFCLGAIAGKYFLSEPFQTVDNGLGVKKVEQIGDPYSNMQENFKKLNDVDIEEYLRLKNIEEKYHKANEIIGKIILMAFLDMGINVSRDKLAYAKKAVIGKSKSLNNKKKIESRNPKSKTDSNGPNDSNNFPSNWLDAEGKVGSIESESELEGFLEAVKVPDLFEALKDSKLVSGMQGAMKELVGSFSGAVHFIDSDKIWRMDLSLSGQIVDQKLTGETLIMLSENGKVHSRTSGNGNLKAFRQFNTESSAILLQTGNWYFQLYYLEYQDSFVGNFYKKKDFITFAYKGTVRLDRT